MSVDLSRVNISLQQFQSISSGKYNAGAALVVENPAGANAKA